MIDRIMKNVERQLVAEKVFKTHKENMEQPWYKLFIKKRVYLENTCIILSKVITSYSHLNIERGKLQAQP